MIGLGYYGTVTPAVIQRTVLENPAWYTAYTPYQPEISQGRLEALINFQTMVADLTGLRRRRRLDARRGDRRRRGDDAGPPGRPGEARRGLRRRRRHAAADPRGAADPRRAAGHRLHVADLSAGWPTDLPEAGAFGVLLSYPGASGAVRDHRALAAAAHEAGASVVVAADLLALTLLEAPGEWGADVACGTTQRFGVPMGYGGPHAGYLSVREGLARQLPGRLVGVSVDADGDVAYRLALQTREQHIRREKATSNICTAQVLLAVMAGAYAVYHGPEGLAAIAARVHRSAAALAGWLRAGGLELVHEHFFDTLDRRGARPGRRGRRRGRAAADQPAPGRRRHRRRRLRRDDDAGRSSGRSPRPSASRPGTRDDDGADALPARAAPPHAVPHPPGLLRAPLRDGDAALPARAVGQGPRAGPHDDPARLLHDEAQRRHRDGRHHLAGVRRTCTRSRRSSRPAATPS